MTKTLNSRAIIGSQLFLLSAFVLTLMISLVIWSGPVMGADSLRLSTSAQVFESLKGTTLEAFTATSGVPVQVHVCSSATALARLENGLCDVAATAERMDISHKEAGFIEHPFCRDALVIITNAQSPAKDLTSFELQAIFSGVVTNWKQIGGPDQPVRVIVPGKQTAAYQYFSREIMRGHDIAWTLMTAKSTTAGHAVRRYPWSISFVTQGATRGRPGGTRIVKLDGRGPSDPGYPLVQLYSLVTRGHPAGQVRKLVDFTYSDQARTIIKRRGMTPSRP